jgi:hypothetical protein
MINGEERRSNKDGENRRRKGKQFVCGLEISFTLIN